MYNIYIGDLMKEHELYNGKSLLENVDLLSQTILTKCTISTKMITSVMIV